jgi:hypothetical protein
VIPGRLLLFKTPRFDLPSDELWFDDGGERTFAASFYADLLQHLGVTYVLSLDTPPVRLAGREDPTVSLGAAFEASGLVVCTAEDLGIIPNGDGVASFSLQVPATVPCPA